MSELISKQRCEYVMKIERLDSTLKKPINRVAEQTERKR